MEAMYYEVPDDGKEAVLCRLCPHMCRIAPAKTGNCGVRKNIDGKLYSLTYDKFTSAALDPIEKKPLYHFHPGSEIMSFGTLGCNFHCQFCQNYEISQREFDELFVKRITVKDAIAHAKKFNAVGIAYTYNEPLINYEWVKEAMAAARESGLENVLVSNGYINEEPFCNIVDLIDAANIDVKSFRDDFYKKYCGGRLGPVLRTVEILVKKLKHLEITTLLIPGLNDSDNEISELADWIWSLNPEIPLHFSRYYPAYKMDIEQTPVATLERAKKIASKKLKFVYIGNVADIKSNSTYCPQCGEMLIERKGYGTKITGLSNGQCRKCGKGISTLVL